MTSTISVGFDSLDAPSPAMLPTDHDRLRNQAQIFKQLFETRRWAELGEHVRVAELWTFDRPMPMAEALGHLETIFRNAIDIHLWVERILKAETTESAGHLSLNCCLMWGEEGTFKEHEFEMDLHFGFRPAATEAAWEISYLGVTPGTVEEVPFPKDEKDKDTKDGRDGKDLPVAPVALAADPEPVPAGYVRVYVPALVPIGSLSSASEPSSDTGDGPSR
jgi:hypothetical protein